MKRNINKDRMRSALGIRLREENNPNTTNLHITKWGMSPYRSVSIPGTDAPSQIDVKGQIPIKTKPK